MRLKIILAVLFMIFEAPIVTIGGEQVTTLKDSVQVARAVGQRGTMSCDVLLSAATRYPQGTPITVDVGRQGGVSTSTIALLHLDSSLADKSFQPNTWTAGNYSFVGGVFGDACRLLALDPNSPADVYLTSIKTTTPIAVAAINDFTMEFRVNFGTFTPATHYIGYMDFLRMGLWTGAAWGGAYQVGFNYNAGYFRFSITDIVADEVIATAQSEEFALNAFPEPDTWYHMALVRASGVMTLYIDGVAYTMTGTAVSTAIPADNYEILFGGGAVLYDFATYTPAAQAADLDEIMLTSAARYTEAFTPAALPFDYQQRLFSGYIVPPQRTREYLGDIYRNINAVDGRYLADKRIVTEAYEEETVGDIVADLITTYLADEGVVAGDIDTGPTLQEAVFNYVTAGRALDILAERVGYWWEIDEDLNLNFQPYEAVPAPFSLVRTLTERGSITVEDGNPQYRNRQYVRNCIEITDEQTESFPGDGETKNRVLSYKAAPAPEMTIQIYDGLSYTPQTVGVQGVDTGKDWYYTVGSNILAQDSAGTALAVGESLIVQYKGQYPVVVLQQDNAAIDTLAAVDGSSGIIDDVYDSPDTLTRTGGQELAADKVSRWSQDASAIPFSTWLPGILPGHLLVVDLPDYGTEDSYLVESMTYRWVAGQLTFDGKAVLGPSSGTWAKFYSELAERGRMISIRENVSEKDALIVVKDFSRDWLEADGPPNPFYRLFPGATTQPGATTWPQMPYGTEVFYVAWTIASAEAGRKIRSKQTPSVIINTTESIYTEFFVGASEAVGDIEALVWWSGTNATAVIGSGAQLDTTVYSPALAKTRLEAWLVRRTDNKWEA